MKMKKGKRALVGECITILEGFYTRESHQYRVVHAALLKLTRDELDALHVMLMWRTSADYIAAEGSCRSRRTST